MKCARNVAACLHRLADLIEQHADETRRARKRSTTASPSTTAANIDLSLVLDCYRYYAGWAEQD